MGTGPHFWMRKNIYPTIIKIIGPSKLANLRTLPLRHAGSGPFPLEGPRSLGY